MNEKNNEFSILDLWHIFIRNIWLIIITSSIFFIVSVIYVFYIVTPDYKSSADVMVQVEQDSGTNSDPNFDLVNAFRLIDTVAELMEKEVVLENAINRLESIGYQDLTANYIRDGLIINTSSSSYFINISFVDENRALAKDAVDSIIEAVIEETDIADAFPVLTDKIRRTSFASDAEYNSPNKILISSLGLLVGLLISLGFVTTRDFFSMKFRSTEEIEETLKLQVLGVIPLKSYKEKSNVKSQK